jgi:hypothetical protein
MPSIATVESLAKALGLSPGWLAYGLGPMDAPLKRHRQRLQRQPDKRDVSVGLLDGR